MTETMPAATRLEMARREIPYAVQRFTQFAVDNPGQLAILAAGTIVVCALARNVVKPRNVIEALALQAVLTAGAPFAAGQIVKRGWLTFKVRDADGALITLPGMEK